MRICSVDAESNGLHGQPFAIGAAVFEDGQEVDHFLNRCPIDGPVDGRVRLNVLPALDAAGIRETASTLGIMLKRFHGWLLDQAFEVPIIAHVAWPVGARLFELLWQDVEDGRDPESGAMPYPLHDVASMLWLVGEDPLSVEGYLAKHGIELPAGNAHDPLFDARCAALVATDLLGWAKEAV